MKFNALILVLCMPIAAAESDIILDKQALLDRPFWSGTYGSISCPLGHQFYEIRWMKNPRVAEDYARYWFETSGAQPRRYTCWYGDSMWAIYQASGDKGFITAMLPHMEAQYA